MQIGRYTTRVTIITVLLLQATVCTALADAEDLPVSDVSAALTVASNATPETEQLKNPLSDVSLKKAGAHIGRIDIQVDNVFDKDDPEENGVLYRAANWLHITSRDKTIRTQLLFASGDVYNHHVLDESARNLRAHSYLNEASIVPVAYHAEDNSVDVVVRVHDVWTFNPGISYGRSGGTNHSGVQLAESNLLGYGKSLSLQSNRTVDRSELGFSYKDPNLLSSRWQLDTTYIHATDGGTQSLNIAHPFFSLETRWSGSVDGTRVQRIDKRYQLAEVVDQYQTTHESYGGQLGWSKGLQDGWVQRWLTGYRIDHLHYKPDPVLGTVQLPQDQQLAYPWAGLSWFEDNFEVMRNRDQIGRTEDVYYGRLLYLQLGVSAPAFGSDRQSVLVELNLQDAWHVSDRQSVFFSTIVSGQHQDQLWRNTLLTTALRYDFQRSHANLFTAKFTSTYGMHLDPTLPLYLGDDDGLRGYPLHYRTGTHREVLNIEQRFYSTWQIFRLLTVGGVAFTDIGHIGGGNVATTDGGQTLADVGIGLRLGSIRSSTGEVFHFNLAYPLNAQGTARKLQFQIVTKQSF